jgi:hypothetical protein
MTDEPRFVAFDVHKAYVMVAALNAQFDIVLSPRRVKMEDLAAWATHWLHSTDRVVLEATSLGSSRASFVRLRLDQLQLGSTIETFAYGGRTIALPPSSLLSTG